MSSLLNPDCSLEVNALDRLAFPAQAHADPPRLRLFTEQMWKQFQRKLQSLGLSPKPKRSEGEGDKPKRTARTPSALSWELAWRRRG
jgi:hypothetical protein